ncbi:NCL [Symbiodinium natans]|uniref:NCL protein n=1 Tax=Symbiodinium natans TaxID=878477 RepID=A0A812QAL8_9DINO|nr:NCL [Symbiodinium natans]
MSDRYRRRHIEEPSPPRRRRGEDSRDRDVRDYRERDVRDRDGRDRGLKDGRDRDRDRSTRDRDGRDGRDRDREPRDRDIRDRDTRDRDREARDRDARDREFREPRELPRERERDRRDLLRDLPPREREPRTERTERGAPSATLQVSRIPPSVTEERLEAVAWDMAVAAGSSMPNAVRFEYDHDRFSGTALLEFPHKDAAKMFKEHVGSSLDVDSVQLEIRYHKGAGEPRSRSRSREHVDRDDPSVTLIVKGIASTTREDAVTGAFLPYAQIKDVRHFARRGFAFVQFHSVEDAIRALNRFDKEGRSRIDGQRVTANFAKEREEPFREGRNFLVAERNFLQKQAIATAEAAFNYVRPSREGDTRKTATYDQQLKTIMKEVEETDSDDGWSPKVTKFDRTGHYGHVQTVDERDVEPADVFFSVDMYDSVLVAAFGGVTMNLDGSDELHVHPGVLFIFCLPLVILQFWLTFCTTFGMPAYWKQLDPNAEESMIISMKLLLIVVVQLTFFDNMLMTLRCFVFAINPTSWTDVKRIDPDDPRTGRSRLNVLHWSPFLAPFPMLALLAKVLMQYWVSVQSNSIILASDNVKEAVFDALAISFIVELDVAMWNLVRTIMHLDQFEDFTFQLWPSDRRETAMRESLIVRNFDCGMLHRGKGARRVESFVVFGALFIIYARITLMTFHAMDTGVLPSSRDVCAMWQWYNGHYDTWEHRVKGAVVLELIDLFSSMSKFPWDIRSEITKMADPNVGGFCEGSNFQPMSVTVAIDIVERHPRSMIGFLIAFSALLLLPQLVYSTGALQKVLKNLDAADLVAEVEIEEEVEAEAAIEQSLLNLRKIQHMSRVFGGHIIDNRARIKRLEGKVNALSGDGHARSSSKAANSAEVSRNTSAGAVTAQSSQFSARVVAAGGLPSAGASEGAVQKTPSAYSLPRQDGIRTPGVPSNGVVLNGQQMPILTPPSPAYSVVPYTPLRR